MYDCNIMCRDKYILITYMYLQDLVDIPIAWKKLELNYLEFLGLDLGELARVKLRMHGFQKSRYRYSTRVKILYRIQDPRS